MNPELQSELRRALFEWKDAGGDVDPIVNAIQEMIHDAIEERAKNRESESDA